MQEHLDRYFQYIFCLLVWPSHIFNQKQCLLGKELCFKPFCYEQFAGYHVFSSKCVVALFLIVPVHVNELHLANIPPHVLTCVLPLLALKQVHAAQKALDYLDKPAVHETMVKVSISRNPETFGSVAGFWLATDLGALSFEFCSFGQLLDAALLIRAFSVDIAEYHFQAKGKNRSILFVHLSKLYSPQHITRYPSTFCHCGFSKNCNVWNLQVAGYLLGEYSHLLARKPGCSPKDIFYVIHDKFSAVTYVYQLFQSFFLLDINLSWRMKSLPNTQCNMYTSICSSLGSGCLCHFAQDFSSAVNKSCWLIIVVQHTDQGVTSISVCQDLNAFSACKSWAAGSCCSSVQKVRLNLLTDLSKRDYISGMTSLLLSCILVNFLFWKVSSMWGAGWKRLNCQSFLWCGANFLFSLSLSDLNLVKSKGWSVSCNILQETMDLKGPWWITVLCCWFVTWELS